MIKNKDEPSRSKNRLFSRASCVKEDRLESKEMLRITSLSNS